MSRDPRLEAHLSASGSGWSRFGSSRYDAYVRELVATITRSAGALSPDVRSAILAGDASKIPPVLAPYVTKVALHAYEIADEDVAGLRRAGLSEDEVFEATAVASVGAALLRLEKGIAALRAV